MSCAGFASPTSALRRPQCGAWWLRFLRKNDTGGGYGLDPRIHRALVVGLVTTAALLLSDPVLDLLDTYGILPVRCLAC